MAYPKRKKDPDNGIQVQGTQCPCCLQPVPPLSRPVVDLQRNVILYQGKWARVSRREAEVLSILVEYWRQFVCKDRLMTCVYGQDPNPPSWKALHRHIVDLRRALDTLGLAILNEYGIGWSIVPKEVEEYYTKKFKPPPKE